jgi:hypothetical protein
MEIWVPYGDVESLVTLMQENLGETIDPKPESHVDEIVVPLAEKMKGVERVFICDQKPATLKVVKALIAKVPREGRKFFSPNPRKVEAAVPDLKEAVERLRPPGETVPESEGKEGKLSVDVAGTGRKFVLSTGEPDPLLGFIDAPVALALGCIEGTRRHAYRKRDGDTPQPLREDSPSYSEVIHECGAVQNAEYATIITRGGEPYSIVEGDSVKQARAHYLSAEVPQAKGLVVGAGGRGYDDTLSHAIRLALGALKGVRKGGEIVLVAECRDGVGSEALQMYLTGRMTESFLKRGAYVDGLEEISYVADLKEKYSVTLLSSLPELYAGGKLKFRTARGSGEALAKVFSSVGRGAKLNVVTRACETVLP